MTESFQLREVLFLIHRRRGSDGLRRTAESYCLDSSGGDEQLIEAIVAEVDGNANRFVLEARTWDLGFWNEVLEQELGAPPAPDLDDVVGHLSTALESRRQAANPSAQAMDVIGDDDTAYPAYEQLSTDAVLPWVRTGMAPFQRQGAQQAFDRLFKDKARAALLCIPEGGGKNRTSLDVVLGACIAKDARVLWVGGSRDLLDLVHEEIRELAWLVGRLGSHRPLFSISRYGCQHRELGGDIVLASADALVRDGVAWEKVEASGEVKLICVDDARLAGAEQGIRALPGWWQDGVPVLGLTGTPVTAEEPGAAELYQLFGDEPVFRKTFKELVDERFLSRPVFVRKRLGSPVALPVSDEDLHWTMEGRVDLPGSMIWSVVQSEARTREVLGHWLDHRERYGKTLLFAHDARHAQALNAWLSERGVSCEAIHAGLTHPQRAQRLDRFRRQLADVLVIAGLMTEGEQVPDARTVMLARPTLDPSLYKQLLGYGARRLPPPVGKTHFFAVDFIDDLERHGLVPAGKAVAVDVGSDFEDTSTMQVQMTFPDRRPGIERALISARAWQTLRCLADDQYSAWGEMIWQRPRGGDKSVIVFHEGVARLRSAVDLVESSLAEGDLASVQVLGSELDWLGALREVDWEEMLSDCAETRQPPWLEKLDDATLPPSGEACARALARLVEDVVSNRTSLPAAMQQCDTLVATDPSVRAHFPDVVAFRQEVLKLYHDASDRFDLAQMATSDRGEQLIEAFIRLMSSVAMADGVLRSEETRAIEKAVGRIFELTSDEQRQWVRTTVEQCSTQLDDPTQATDTLRRLATTAELYNMYDWLFRVAFADGEFASEEQQFLKAAADALGIQPEEHEELVRRYTASLVNEQASIPPPAPVQVVPFAEQQAPRLRFCTACGYPREGGAQFCVACGAELRTDLV